LILYDTVTSPLLSSEEEEEEREDSSPLDLSSKSDEEQSTSLIEFQMESHEGEPENPNMSKVC
jgi:hypothetical protein